MMNALNIPFEEFLRPFFEPGEKVCLRIFDDRKTGTFKGAKLETTIESINKMLNMLNEHNRENRGIYFVVNSGGHEDGDISRINAHFVENDDLPLEEQLALIESFPIPPSLIVKTRKSLHTYWLMKNAKVDSFRRIQKRLIKQFGGDKVCINESRVLRLPGFYHCKEEPVMVECIKFNPELRYTQEELEAVLPSVEEEHAQAAVVSAKSNRKGLVLVSRRCDFIRHCINNAASLSEHDWYAMISNLAVFEDGDKLIHEMSSMYPGYNRDQTQEKINHFLASGTKPMTCKTISEKGFVCPKLGTADCICKAPAALCYKPLSVEDLREMLRELETTKSAVDNIGTAQQFVQDYLYNIDSIVAGTFIEHEIKEHFGLKLGEVKPLSAAQRELYKAYRSSKDVKSELSEHDLPEWYEPTERGGMRFISGILAEHMTKNVEAFYGAGSYFYYQNGVYTMYEDLWASAKVREYMVSRYASMSTINDTVGQWCMLIRKPVREINCNPFIINVRNGLYNVLEDKLKPHTPEYFSTVQINACFNLNVQCSHFMSFLKSILQDEEILLIQEIFGYLLIPVNKAQKSFVFVGAPNAGKSTLLSVAQEILLGSDNVSNIPWQSLSDRFNKAELFGKLANIFADLPSKSIDDNGMFKAHTGEDYITAERKNKDPFSFRPYARLLFSCNEIPRNYGDRSDGFYRRLIIIRFNKSVPKSRIDPNLREKIAVERDGILMWALVGLKRLIGNNYCFSETERTKAELQKYKVESNSVLSFVDEYCVIEDDKCISRDELFSRYQEYCIGTGLKGVSQISFNKELETNYINLKRSREKLLRRHIWSGITFCEGGKDG